jgi:hypothetical protein
MKILKRSVVGDTYDSLSCIKANSDDYHFEMNFNSSQLDIVPTKQIQPVLIKDVETGINIGNVLLERRNNY